MPCLKCGRCCEGIGLTATMDHVRNVKTPDALFIMKNWREVTLSKASRLNERLRGADTRNYFSGFFICSKYDKKRKLCTINGSKPFVCSGYPFYNHCSLEGKAFMILDKGCGYEFERARYRLLFTLKKILREKEWNDGHESKGDRESDLSSDKEDARSCDRQEEHGACPQVD